MITVETFNEIVAVYVRHGWALRRVLLSPALRDALKPSISKMSDHVLVSDSDIDAAWFSRPPLRGGVPWEIRHLSDNPYALLYTIDELDAEFEDSLLAGENKFRESVSSRKSA